MSQQGYVSWVTNDLKSLDFHGFLSVLDVVGCEQIEAVFEKLSSNDHTLVNRPTLSYVCDVIAPVQAFKLIKEEKVLQFESEWAKLGDALRDELQTMVSEDVRGDFLPDRTFISLGNDLLFDNDHPDSPQKINGMVSCWGYNTPYDCDATRKAILSLDVVKDMATKLTPLFGEVETKVYWYY